MLFMSMDRDTNESNVTSGASLSGSTKRGSVLAGRAEDQDRMCDGGAAMVKYIGSYDETTSHDALPLLSFRQRNYTNIINKINQINNLLYLLYYVCARNTRAIHI